MSLPQSKGIFLTDNEYEYEYEFVMVRLMSTNKILINLFRFERGFVLHRIMMHHKLKLYDRNEKAKSLISFDVVPMLFCIEYFKDNAYHSLLNLRAISIISIFSSFVRLMNGRFFFFASPLDSFMCSNILLYIFRRPLNGKLLARRMD